MQSLGQQKMILKLSKYSLHARTLPSKCCFVKSVNICSNLILKTLEITSCLSITFKFIGDNNLCISRQLGLHVKVINKSGIPTLLHIVIPSKYSCSMYLGLQTSVEGKMILFPLFDP